MRTAFTLVELLASTVLTAMLAAAVLAVVASLGRSNRVMAAQHADHWPPLLVQLFRFDLLNGRDVKTEPNAINITGYGQLDRQTDEPTHEAGLVRYAVQQVGDHSWLVRTQQQPGQPSFRELVCADVDSIEIRPVSSMFSTRLLSSIRPTTQMGNEKQLPRQMALVVRSSHTTVPALNEVLTLR